MPARDVIESRSARASSARATATLVGAKSISQHPFISSPAPPGWNFNDPVTTKSHLAMSTPADLSADGTNGNLEERLGDNEVKVNQEEEEEEESDYYEEEEDEVGVQWNRPTFKSLIRI